MLTEYAHNPGLSSFLSDGWVTRLESDRCGGITIDINKYMRRARKSYTMYYIFVDIADHAEGMGVSGNP